MKDFPYCLFKGVFEVYFELCNAVCSFKVNEHVCKINVLGENY